MKYLAHELFKGRKCSYEGSVKSFFKEYRPDDVKSRISGIENNIRNSGERLLVQFFPSNLVVFNSL